MTSTSSHRWPATRLIASLLLTGCQFLPAFQAQEEKISISSEKIVDNEYDQRSYQTTWNEKGTLKVMALDPDTGDFLHLTRQDIATGLAPITGEQGKTGAGNGPEWVWTDQGSQILFTIAPKQRQEAYEVYHAVQNDFGWTSGPLPGAAAVSFGSRSFAPTGTFAPLGATPRVSAIICVPNSPFYAYSWRNLEDSRGQQIGDPTPGVKGGRWQLGDNNTFAYIQLRQEISQVFLYDVATRRSKQLTFDATEKKDPFIFKAAEFAGRRVMITSIDQTNIGLYQENAGGSWTFVKNIRPPTQLKDLRSAEPVIYNGQTYLTMVAENDGDQPSEIWLAGIRPDIPFYREVSNHPVPKIRNDPETLATSLNGLVVYFTDHGAGDIYRCLTGLGRPVEKILPGTAGNDQIVGSELPEQIIGGMGSDTLTGGGGSDHFVMNLPSEGVDTVTDFKAGRDVIDLHLILAGFHYRGNNPLADGYVRVQASVLSTDTDIRVDGDGNGPNKTGTKVFTIKGVPPEVMNSSDNFIF